MSLTSWFLLSGGGTRHRLPREMIFVGRDDCELMLQSRSVDKQHAVINYEPNTDEHKVKDLGSLNGTFVNDVRIQEQIYVTLKIDDKLRFGYDTNLFTVVRGEMLIPEEALKHEKLSSQLQLGQKKISVQVTKSEEKAAEVASTLACEAATAKAPEVSRVEDKTAAEIAVLHRGTPLYGQPAWWGDGDCDEQQAARPEEKSSDKKRDKAETGKTGGEVAGQNTEVSSSGEAMLGHASFTIEFDPGASGKVTVKDRVAKGGQDTKARTKRPVGEDLSPLQTAMVAAEVKVADWLAQNELPLALKETAAPEEDGESAKSDVPVHLRSLQGSKHEDGTQSDTENTLGEQRRAVALEERSWGLWGGPGVKFREGRANVPEGLFAEEDSPARRRKTPNSKAVSGFVERRRGSAPHQQSGRDECYRPGDDYSDRATYTIEMENGDREEEVARKMTYRTGDAAYYHHHPHHHHHHHPLSPADYCRNFTPPSAVSFGESSHYLPRLPGAETMLKPPLSLFTHPQQPFQHIDALPPLGPPPMGPTPALCPPPLTPAPALCPPPITTHTLGPPPGHTLVHPPPPIAPNPQMGPPPILVPPPMDLNKAIPPPNIDVRTPPPLTATLRFPPAPCLEPPQMPPSLIPAPGHAPAQAAPGGEQPQDEGSPPGSEEQEDPLGLDELCKPLYCKLCNVTLNSTQQAQAHYQGKNHSKKLRNFYAGSQQPPAIRITDTPDSNGQTSNSSGGSEGDTNRPALYKGAARVILATENDYCKLCDASFSSPAVAQAHYQGKNHAKRLRLQEAQSNANNSNEASGEVSSKRSRKENEYRAVKSRRSPQLPTSMTGPYYHPRPRQRIPRDLAMCVTPSGQFYCSMCNCGAEQEPDFRQHLESKQHKAKVSELRYRNEMETLGYS